MKLLQKRIIAIILSLLVLVTYWLSFLISAAVDSGQFMQSRQLAYHQADKTIIIIFRAPDDSVSNSKLSCTNIVLAKYIMHGIDNNNSNALNLYSRE
jgi:hypothetical protein